MHGLDSRLKGLHRRDLAVVLPLGPPCALGGRHRRAHNHGLLLALPLLSLVCCVAAAGAVLRWAVLDKLQTVKLLLL